MEEQKKISDGTQINPNLLPVPKEKSIGIMKLANGVDNIKSIAKTLAWSAIAMGTAIYGTTVTIGIAGASTVGSIALGISTAIASTAFLNRMASSMALTEEPGLLFGISKFKDRQGRKDIEQQFELSKAIEMWRIPEENAKEQKLGIMQLQLLMCISRMKDRLSGNEYTEKEDGTKVYNQLFTTVTHNSNARTLNALAKLGILEMLEIEEKIGKKDKITGEPTEKRSLIIAQRFGFGNKTDLKDCLRCVIERDWDGLDKKRKVFKRYTFRLTNKPMDFANLYAKTRGIIPFESEEERLAVEELSYTFSSSRGALAKLNYDIRKDFFGRDTLVKTAIGEENFSQRIDREVVNAVGRDGCSSRVMPNSTVFDQGLKRGVPRNIKPIINDGTNRVQNIGDKIHKTETGNNNGPTLP